MECHHRILEDFGYAILYLKWMRGGGGRHHRLGQKVVDEGRGGRGGGVD